MAMAPQSNGNGIQGQPQDQVPEGQQAISMLAQYIKDLSFENPNAPRSLGPQAAAPQINLQVNVQAKQLGGDDYEVELSVEGGAGEGANTLFRFELSYAGVIRLVNIPADSAHPAVMIEGPRLLFPFARQIIAEATRQGGFPPLMIDPIDFVSLYRNRMAAGAQPDAPQTA